MPVNSKEFGYHGCNLNPIGQMNTRMIRIQFQAIMKTHQIENFKSIVSKRFKFLGKNPQKMLPNQMMVHTKSQYNVREEWSQSTNHKIILGIKDADERH